MTLPLPAGTQQPVDAQYITWADLKEMTEFPVIASKSSVQLDLYVDRAHEAVRGFGPFEDHGMADYFAASMRIALFLTAEGLALSNATKPALLAGIQAEGIGKYNYTLNRPTTSGNPRVTQIVPDEAISILQFWTVLDSFEVLLDTTNVFPTTRHTDPNNPLTLVPTTEDWARLAPAYWGVDPGSFAVHGQ